MKPEVKAWAESMGIDCESASAEQLAAIEANYEGRNASPAKTKPKTKLEDVLAAAKAEQERCERIAEIAGEAIAANPSQLDAIQALAELAERSKWQSDKFELELLRATRPQGHTVMRPRRDERLSGKVLEAALCQTILQRPPR